MLYQHAEFFFFKEAAREEDRVGNGSFWYWF